MGNEVKQRRMNIKNDIKSLHNTVYQTFLIIKVFLSLSVIDIVPLTASNIIVIPTSPPYHHHRIIRKSDYNSQLSIASYVCVMSVKCTPRNKRVVLKMFLYPSLYNYVRNSRHVCTLRIPRISLSLRVHVQFLVQQ